MAAARTILHADMDAFYASVEQRDDPSLRGKPVAVGGRPPRGVIAAASYEARPFGVRSAIPTTRALADCPQLVLLSPRMEHYADVSKQVFSIFRSYSPLVEGLSLDEAFIDISGTDKLFGDPEALARDLKQRVRNELALVVSVGIGPSKLIAKIASDLDKPDGLCVVRPDEARAFLHALPVSRLFGVGKVTQKALSNLGVSRIGELAALPLELLVKRCGKAHGEQLYRLARGQDEREVTPDQAPKSIGHEDTFERDIHDADELSAIIRQQAQTTCRRLRRQGFVAKTVVVKAKTARFEQRTRQRALSRPSADDALIADMAERLLRALLRQLRAPLRLTGVTCTDLSLETAPRQLSFDEPRHEKGERLARTLDRIAERFGDDTVARGAPPKTKKLRDR